MFRVDKARPESSSAHETTKQARSRERAGLTDEALAGRNAGTMHPVPQAPPPHLRAVPLPIRLADRGDRGLFGRDGLG